MSFQQPKPESKSYADLIHEIGKGIIKIPKFQRDFVWSIDKTADLLDSVLKGYPVGTFILWQTDERMNDIRNIGNFELPETPHGVKVQYVLDGQQRMTSLFAAYCGAEIQKEGEKKVTDYKSIVVNLDEHLDENEDQIITAEPTGEKYAFLHDVLNFDYDKAEELSANSNFNKDDLKRISAYHNAFQTYNFSTVVLRKEDIGSAIEVFTRINTGGQTLTLFEIMSAKTYDEAQGFDMQAKWKRFIKELEAIKYEEVYSTVILSLLSLVLSKSKECRRETILALDKQDIIDHWAAAISALKDSIDYFRTTYRIPVSRLLPYDTLLVPFAYFFFKNQEEYNRKEPDSGQRQYLEEFFWRMSLSHRYTGAGDTLLAQDIRRIDRILEHERPDYADVKVDLSTETLIQTYFHASDSYCKAVLCLLAYQEPKDFHDNGKVILDNSNLKRASSRNYHHFFPKSYLKKNETANSNSLVNITLVSDGLNKRIIRARAPSDYIRDFTDENPGINKALNSHCIDINGFGIESDDYDTFLEARASRISEELKARIDLNHRQPDNEEIQELIAAGESERVELKSTLRYDLRAKSPNKKIEYAIAKTIAAFLNSEGGDLFIGIDDEHNALGLEDDIQTLSKNNLDGFNLHLVGIIRNYIGGDYSGHVKITFPVYDDVEICRVQVAKSSESVFTTFEGKQDFFVRSSCASIPLTPQEQSGYEKKHYGS